MLCVFDVNETLLDLAALDEFFADLTGAPEARREWFGLLIHSALTLTAARRYRPFGEIAAVSGAVATSGTNPRLRNVGTVKVGGFLS